MSIDGGDKMTGCEKSNADNDTNSSEIRDALEKLSLRGTSSRLLCADHTGMSIDGAG